MGYSSTIIQGNAHYPIDPATFVNTYLVIAQLFEPRLIHKLVHGVAGSNDSKYPHPSPDQPRTLRLIRAAHPR